MAFYDNAVDKIAAVVNIANGGRDALTQQGLHLTALQVQTIPGADGLMGIINLAWDEGAGHWQIQLN